MPPFTSNYKCGLIQTILTQSVTVYSPYLATPTIHTLVDNKDQTVDNTLTIDSDDYTLHNYVYVYTLTADFVDYPVLTNPLVTTSTQTYTVNVKSPCTTTPNIVTTSSSSWDTDYVVHHPQ